MFENIGGKIKGLAKVTCWIGIVASVILGIILIAADEDLVLTGIITAAIGAVASWVSSFVLYGFGQLVENSDRVVYYAHKSVHPSHTGQSTQTTGYSLSEMAKNREQGTTKSTGGWYCQACGTKNDTHALLCKDCGKYR